MAQQTKRMQSSHFNGLVWLAKLCARNHRLASLTLKGAAQSGVAMSLWPGFSYHLGSHVHKAQLLDFKPLEFKLPIGLYAYVRHALVVVTRVSG